MIVEHAFLGVRRHKPRSTGTGPCHDNTWGRRPRDAGRSPRSASRPQRLRWLAAAPVSAPRAGTRGPTTARKTSTDGNPPLRPDR